MRCLFLLKPKDLLRSKHRQASAFLLKTALVLDPCQLQGGEDMLQGMDGGMGGGMAPVTSGESRAKEKEATGWESMPAEAEGTVLLCLAFSSMRWRTRKD